MTNPTPEQIEAVAWLHTMTYETGETVHRLTFDDGTDPDEPKRTAFGFPGRDYSEEFAVTSTPLVALQTLDTQGEVSQGNTKERALELLATAYEGEGRPITAGDLRCHNTGSQGVRWVRTECAIAAVESALSSTNQREEERERTLTAAEVRAVIRERIKSAGNQKAFARSIGVSASYLSDVLKERREPGVSILHHFGLNPVTVYRPFASAELPIVKGSPPVGDEGDGAP